MAAAGSLPAAVEPLEPSADRAARIRAGNVAIEHLVAEVRAVGGLVLDDDLPARDLLADRAALAPVRSTPSG
jgi:hypothetical protein